MMKHLQKPAVQMILLLVVVGIGAAAFYLSKQPPQAINAPKTKAGVVIPPQGLLPEEKTVNQDGTRFAARGDEQDVQKFYPPPKKPAPPTIITTTAGGNNGKPQQPPPYPKLAHIAAAQTEDFTPSPPTLFAPRGTLIKAALVLTLDSSALDTPVLALVTEDVYFNKKLIVPAGTQVISKASTGRTRDRIEIKGNFTFIWTDGREYSISGVALDHERLPDGSFSITDGSTGVRGQIIKNDQYAELKILVAEALQGVMNNNQSQFQTIYGLAPQNTDRNAALGGGSQAASAYSGMLTKKLEQDLDFVRVGAGTQFYIFINEVFEPGLASIAGLKQGNKAASSWQIAEEAYNRASAASAASQKDSASVAEATRKAEEERKTAERAARVNELVNGGKSGTPASTSTAPNSSTP